ncbi:transcription factor NF-E2 45 kDa subunit isoform X1 [Bufo gargarizans]|uniref:transcription factor NF-E2 45 kDa subunit isoform X1 n=2 Tax=Bufo gargarizans TaxID=30331 RepID=UPI001CF1AC8C|nr:transcription factor NF-E2 45 kDa subunit isoform X1 [Bufo gargarizans]
MGEQCAHGDMDLTWQEIFSITELQGLDLQPDSSYDVESGYQTPIPPTPGCSFSSFSRDGIVPTANCMAISSRSYMDCQAQNAAIPMTSGYGPTSYTGMLISSSMSQMGAINHYASKHIPPSAMSAPGNQVIMPEPYLSSVNSLHLPSKNHDDFETDSGLSLNFSDGESIEIENIDSHRLHSEFMEIIPQHAYQNQYPLATNLTQPVIENMCETETYFASRTQELVCSRDQRRAVAMQIPFPADRIVNLPVEEFNELLSRYTLTESQLALVRDIRRRGKNKVAAQNCRKRKMENISILEKEIGQLRSEREGLRREREEVESIISELKSNMKVLQKEVYSILKNQGNHHYPEDILLHQTPNDNVSFSLQ